MGQIVLPVALLFIAVTTSFPVVAKDHPPTFSSIVCVAPSETSVTVTPTTLRVDVGHRGYFEMSLEFCKFGEQVGRFYCSMEKNAGWSRVLRSWFDTIGVKSTHIMHVAVEHVHWDGTASSLIGPHRQHVVDDIDRWGNPAPSDCLLDGNSFVVDDGPSGQWPR